MKTNTNTKKKVTLMIDTKVYEGLRARVGARGVGAYLSQLARPYAKVEELEESYKALAASEDDEHLAKEWLDGTEDPIDDENVWQF